MTNKKEIMRSLSGSAKFRLTPLKHSTSKNMDKSYPAKDDDRNYDHHLVAIWHESSRNCGLFFEFADGNKCVAQKTIEDKATTRQEIKNPEEVAKIIIH